MNQQSEEKSRRSKRECTFDQLKEYFNVPLSEAAQNLGVSETCLKRISREHGVNRWPYRRLSSVLNQIETLESQPQTLQTKAKIDKMKEEVAFIYEHGTSNYVKRGRQKKKNDGDDEETLEENAPSVTYIHESPPTEPPSTDKFMLKLDYNSVLRELNSH